MKQQKSSSKSTTSSKVARAATGVAITAGVVAVSATLAKKENRRKLKDMAMKGAQNIKEATQELASQTSRAYASNIQSNSKDK